MLVPLPSSMSKLDKHILVLGSVSLLQGYCITTLKYQGVCHVKKQNYRFFLLVCVQAMENFAWNIRVLRGQADLLSQAKKDCNEYIRQVRMSTLDRSAVSSLFRGQQ